MVPNLSLVLAVLAVVTMLAVAIYAAPRLTRGRQDLTRPPSAVTRRALTILFVGLSVTAVLTVTAIGLFALHL